MHKYWFNPSSLIAILTTMSIPWAAFAQSPPGFAPIISNHLTVTCGTAAINPAGITVPGTGEFIPH
jgi:hypothetical protein